MSNTTLDWIDYVVRDLCEIPYRSSPDDFPEGVIVTAEEIREAIARHLNDALAALQSPAQQLVPVEPTEEMLAAAFLAPIHGHPETGSQRYDEIYKAMLLAAKESKCP